MKWRGEEDALDEGRELGILHSTLVTNRFDCKLCSFTKGDTGTTWYPEGSPWKIHRGRFTAEYSPDSKINPGIFTAEDKHLSKLFTINLT